MNCKHKWIGNTCCECGVAWNVWAERQISYIPTLKLDALREGMRRAAKRIKKLDGFFTTQEVVNDILSAAENLSEEDL